jgi:sugar O-acyltransferase (sialic acid O-acetyltransferase NeuD family)
MIQMKPRYIIVGAGGFGRELALAVELQIAISGGELLGFLDDTVDPLGANASRYPPILGPTRQFSHSAEYTLLLGVSDPAAKMSMVTEIEAKGGVFGTFIHPQALVMRTSSLGRGCIVCKQAGASADANIGDYVLLNSFSGVAHDCAIGNGTTMSSFVDVCGRATVGRQVFIGSHATILPGVDVGDGARIGAGSVVVRRVKPGQAVYQPAARVLSDES